MQVPFSELPGRHERHYKRKLNNPLFSDSYVEVDSDILLEMQRLDHEELLKFLTKLRETVQKAVDLKPNVESDVVLGLKEDLDRLYEQSAGLADEQSGNQQAIRQLLAVIMKTVWESAGNDPKAMQELEMETQARTMHFELLSESLVADILHPESTISPQELAATLLTESESALGAALQLFDAEQSMLLLADARELVDAFPGDDERKAHHDHNYALIAKWCDAQKGAVPLNA